MQIDSKSIGNSGLSHSYRYLELGGPVQGRARVRSRQGYGLPVRSGDGHSPRRCFLAGGGRSRGSGCRRRRRSRRKYGTRRRDASRTRRRRRSSRVQSTPERLREETMPFGLGLDSVSVMVMDRVGFRPRFYIFFLE